MPSIGEAERAAVLAVLDSGRLVQGARVEELEARWAAATGSKHAVAVSSGTAALHLALLAHGIAPGDEVITSPFTFVASVNSILLVGAKPVFVDIEPDTLNLDAARVEQAITARTRALMPVHLYGQPCDMAPLLELAAARGLVIVEDAAQAIGAAYRGSPAGSFGTACFSLYATKNVMAGEGGMVTTGDSAIDDRLRLLRNHGMRRRYEYETLGFNYRLSEIHAALGLAQLARLGDWNRARQENASRLSAGIRSLTTPVARADRTHAWHQYTVRVDRSRDRDLAAQRLSEAGIDTSVFYPLGVHQLQHVRAVAGDASLPIAERAAGEVLSLPVHPGVGEDDLGRIVEAVNRL